MSVMVENHKDEISIGVIENFDKSDTRGSLSSGYCSQARVPRIEIDRFRVIPPSNFTVAVVYSNLHGTNIERLAFPAKFC